jgi:hypothetical protein
MTATVAAAAPALTQRPNTSVTLCIPSQHTAWLTLPHGTTKSRLLLVAVCVKHTRTERTHACARPSCVQSWQPLAEGQR